MKKNNNFKKNFSGYLEYRALYDYEARNADELSFNVDDIILVHPGQEHEPGWLGGQLRGQVGWFPEAYAERVSWQCSGSGIRCLFDSWIRYLE
jgi:hypothetical protein